jgi:hypothetical protein
MSDDWRSRQPCDRASSLGDFADPPRQVWVSLSNRDDGELAVSVDGYHGRLGDLMEKLRQYPRGTTFSWNDHLGDSLERWTLSERDALFDRLRREAAAFGIVLQRERTYRARADAPWCGEWPANPVPGRAHQHGPVACASGLRLAW